MFKFDGSFTAADAPRPFNPVHLHMNPYQPNSDRPLRLVQVQLLLEEKGCGAAHVHRDRLLPDSEAGQGPVLLHHASIGGHP